MVCTDARIDINESQIEYKQHNMSPSALGEKKDQHRKSMDEKVWITTYYNYLQHIIIDKPLWWFTCHWSWKVLGIMLQCLVIGDVVSDVYFLWCVIKYEVGWWVFFSLIILYLTLRSTLVFTALFEEDFFGVKDSNGVMGKFLYFMWEKFRWITCWDKKFVQPTLGTIISLFIPGAWQFVYLLSDEIGDFDTFSDVLLAILIVVLSGLYVLIIEVILVPIYALLVSPFILLTHVVKGINDVWKIKSISFYHNSFEIQTTIFYSTMVSLFESVIESLPQFLLQSWIFYRSQDLIPESTYYISVSLSLVNILKAIIIFIIARKELLFSTIRLVDNITTASDICEWNDGILELKLGRKNKDCIVKMVQYYSNSNIQHLDVKVSMLADDDIKDIVKHLIQLKSLDVSYTNISDKGIICIAKNCQQLINLDLSYTRISDKGLIATVANCHQLESLNLWKTNVTDEGIKAIAEYCLKLKSLNLSKTSVTDEGLKAIAKNCLQLNTLNLWVTNVTDEGLKAIADNCLELESIILNSTKVTDLSVSLLLSNCKQLRKLNLSCKTLIHKYRQEYPNMKIGIW